ncbi:hypothetical protein KIW84_056864 [Lathyrus oleraceus]|uniref:Uncharacterized protein n=1 Tax=Pisum sativum TaxID=3888 RepID=A0A9D4X1M6_PEA|nr:hypothetical protein KIW84_056864 [Pisum sativum]
MFHQFRDKEDEEDEEEEDIGEVDVAVMEVQYTKINGRWLIVPEGSSPAAVSIREVIQELYKHSWKSFGQLYHKDKKLYKTCFERNQEKCTWEIIDEPKIERNFRRRVSTQLYDMLRYNWRKEKKNGKIYGVGSLAANYRTSNRTLFTRITYGEGSSCPPILTPEMAETIRQLAQGEAAREAVAREAATCEAAQKG